MSNSPSEVLLNGEPLILQQVVLTHEMPITEQAAMVHSCDILMGPHGAGLVHAVWMYPGSVVIEILDHEHEAAAYFRNIAHLSGHVYFKYRKDQLDNQPEPAKSEIFEFLLVSAAEIVSNKASFSKTVSVKH